MAIDRHQSVTTSNWTSMLEHVALFVEYFTIDTTTNRVGLVSFDEVSSLDIPLNKHSNTTLLQQDIRSQPYGGSGRDLSNAIQRIQLDCFRGHNGEQSMVEGLSQGMTHHFSACCLRGHNFVQIHLELIYPL